MPALPLTLHTSGLLLFFNAQLIVVIFYAQLLISHWSCCDCCFFLAGFQVPFLAGLQIPRVLADAAPSPWVELPCYFIYSFVRLFIFTASPALSSGQGVQPARAPFEFCDPLEPAQLRPVAFPATNGSSPRPRAPAEQGRGAVTGPNPFPPDTGTCCHRYPLVSAILRSR